MEQFIEVNYKDLNLIKDNLSMCKKEMCDYTVSCFYMWKDYFNYEYIIHNGYMLIRGNDVLDSLKKAYMMPLCRRNRDNAIKYLLKINNNVVVFNGVDEEDKDYLVDNYNATALKLEGWSDYIYLASELSFLKGEKFKKKRNLVNKFHKTYSKIEFREVCENDIDMIIANFSKWYDTSTMSDVELFDYNTTIKTIEEYKLFNLIGGLLFVDDLLVAFSFFAISDDFAYVHIEKANKDIAGSYQAINNYIASLALNKYNITYLNREEDMGDLGLRKAKMSYNPVKLIDKYQVIIKKN